MRNIPWTSEEVRLLNLYQSSQIYHPYTCFCGRDSILKATPEGWWCDKCEAITQTWFSLIVPDIENQIKKAAKWQK